MMGMRHESPFRMMKKIIDDGVLGDIQLIHGQKSYKMGSRPTFFHTRETYGGTIPWVGSHPLDMIYWLSGSKRYLCVSASHSTRGNNDHHQLESSAAMLLQMEDEIIATINIDYLRPSQSKTHGDDRLRIIGTDGWAEIVDGMVYLNGTLVEDQLPNGNIFTDLCLELLGTGQCSITNQDSLYITKICLVARDAADNNTRIEVEDII